MSLLRQNIASRKEVIAIDVINAIRACHSRPVLLMALSVANLSAKEMKALEGFIFSGYDTDEEVSYQLTNKYGKGFSRNSYRKHKESALKKCEKCWCELNIIDLIKESVD